VPDLAGRLAQLGGILRMRGRQQLGFGAGADVVGGARDLERMLDADLA